MSRDKRLNRTQEVDVRARSAPPIRLSFQADRGPERRYVTAPLRALFDVKKIHKCGFYHDGRFATLPDVVEHYAPFSS